MTRSRWRGCESLQEMKVRFASTLLPSSSSLLPSLYRVAIEYHTLGLFTIWTTFKIAEYRIQNTKLYWPFLQTSQPVSEISCRHNCTRWCMYKYTHTLSRSNQVGTESLGGEATLISHHRHKVGRQSGNQCTQSMSIVDIVGARRDWEKSGSSTKPLKTSSDTPMLLTAHPQQPKIWH